MSEINIVIVEDHDDLRDSLRLILNTTPGYRCSGSFVSCEALFEAIEIDKIAPQIVIMDIGLPGMSGIDGVRKLKSLLKETHILMFTVFEDDANVFRAICAGASGYLLKEAGPLDIVKAIDDVAKGDIPMTPVIARKVMEMFRDFAPKPELCENLTPREAEVLKLLIDGLDYKQIAGKLFISANTVRNHLRNIYEKLRVHSKSGAVAKALKQRLV